MAAGTLFGCDASTDTPISDAAAPSTESYTYNDGSTVRVVIDAEYAPERATFASLDIYHEHLEQLDDNGTISVNAALWARLRHANDPAEVSVLGSSGTVVVGGHLYEVNEEGVYRRPLSDEGAEQELVFYYGLDGEADLEEFSRAAASIHGAPVDPSEFRNPFAQEIVRNAVSYSEPASNIDGRTYGCVDWQGSNSSHFATCEEGQIYFPYNMTNIVAPGHQGAPGDYDVRAWMLNQSYRKVFKKKAYAVTQAQIRRVGDPAGFTGLQVCPAFDDSVDLPPYTIVLRNAFEVEVRVEGSTSSRVGCIVNHRADRSGGSESTHRMWKYVFYPNDPGYGFYTEILSDNALPAGYDLD